VSSPAQSTRIEPARAAGWWLDAVRLEERRGELLTAFDLAERGLAEHPDELWLKHRAVLALARAGATEEAARRFEEYGLAGVPDEDVAALEARIAKDLALAAAGPERRREAARAARLYGAVFERTGGYYPAINAATLHLVAGDRTRARALAATVLELLVAKTGDSYYAAATEAEARLLRGELAAAMTALERAAALHGQDYGALGGTRRQLRLICEELALDPQTLSLLAGPDVVHFCGHRMAEQGGLSPSAEQAVAGRLAAVVSARQPGFAYGSLASGADILWAEALLAGGAELHVVLPFARQEFINSSVAPAGGEWVERFDRCLAAAASVRYATDDAYLGDDVLFRYAAELAMGLALLRARYLDADVRQLAVWDGQPARTGAGTAVDVATWQSRGRPVTVISPTCEVTTTDATGARSPDAPGRASDAAARSGGRAVHAILFGDVQRFSQLNDEQFPAFADRFLGAFAAVLARHERDVLSRNTWGDAIHVVLTDAAAAARCALDLQDAIGAIDLAAEGLPDHLALRLGGHLGPVFPTPDPVRGLTAYMGSHVSRTARIEPVTPPGTVYVTEPFAAALELDDRQEFACDYVGHMDAAKDYGRLRMYRLRRRR
jgi:Adenylate and Guanylate cyclase catalytic domain/MAP3K TRAFs-binding domain